MQRTFEAEWLSVTFSEAVFLGNGLVAIIAGLVANYLVVDLDFGPVAPFDAAAVLLAIGCCIIVLTWPENLGDANAEKTLRQQFQQAWLSIVAGKSHATNHAHLCELKDSLANQCQSSFTTASDSSVLLAALVGSRLLGPHSLVQSYDCCRNHLATRLTS